MEARGDCQGLTSINSTKPSGALYGRRRSSIETSLLPCISSTNVLIGSLNTRSNPGKSVGDMGPSTDRKTRKVPRLLLTAQKEWLASPTTVIDRKKCSHTFGSIRKQHFPSTRHELKEQSCHDKNVGADAVLSATKKRLYRSITTCSKL